MRILGRLLLILLVAVPSLFVANRIWDSLRWDELAAVLSGRIETALPSTAYLAVNDQWLGFKLSGQGGALRVRTNAVVDGHARQEQEAEWWYAFEYQLLDDQYRVLRQGVYHHRTRVTLFRDPQSGRLASRNFLLDPALDPTDGRSMLIDFGRARRPSGVRIRPLRKDPRLHSLMFRVYEKLPTPEDQLGYRWQRLAEAKKARLSRGSVYGLDLLREPEKQNLLRHEWKPVGPLGVENEQYRTAKLYIAREPEGESILEGPKPYGLYCSAVLRGMIPLPEGVREVSLEIVNLGSQGEVDADVRVHWYGRGITQRWQTRLPSSSGKYRLGKTFDGGQLEIVAAVPVVVRAWGRVGGERIEFTPRPLRLRAYLVDATGSLAVDIDHVARRPTPFRVDIRSRLHAGEDAVARTLVYELLDGAGNPIRDGRLSAQLRLSNYDRLPQDAPGIHLSEPFRYYFDLPAEVAAVRFSSRHELLLTTYTRPPNMTRRVRVPEDYLAVDEDLHRQPAWFVLRPVGEETLRREFRTLMLSVQQRPPEADPRMLAGDYDWTLYQPVGSWRARHLLVPRREELPLRERSLAAVYREVSGARAMPLSFRGLPGRRAVHPSLLFLRDRASPLDVRVTLGGQLHSKTQIAGRQGEWQLPPIDPGSQSLSISAAESVRWFINQTQAPGPAYLRRLAMHMGKEGLAFDYLKPSNAAEVLSGELYLPSPERIGLRVTITGEHPSNQGPLQEWTFRERLFDLKPEGKEPIPVLNSAQPPLVGSQRFFLPLGSDLPPGRYRIRFVLEGATQAFLTLYQLTPGQSELRAFFREPADGLKTGV